MARLLSDNSIQMADGRILDPDEILYGQDFIEIIHLLMPAPIWPMVNSGGSGVGNNGKDGVQGPQGQSGQANGSQGFQGFQGVSGVLGNQGNQGFQGFQGVGGPTQAAVFDFTHTAGSASTGALGFTPKFVIYSGVIQQLINVGADAHSVVHSTGFAIGTGGNARTAVMGVGSSTSLEVDVGGAATDSSAIAGDPAMTGTVEFDIMGTVLDVTSFAAAGITLTWSAAVGAHEGKLIVLGG